MSIDRLVTAVEGGRLRSALLDLLDEEPFSRVQEWAESLAEIAEAIDNARDALEVWQNEEEREAKADARDGALDALQQVVDLWNASPLDVSKLEDWNPEEEQAS